MIEALSIRHKLVMDASEKDKEETDAVGHYARTLNCNEVEKLKSDSKLVSEFRQKKLELEARKNWDLFYKRNETRFFKDRHWTIREFEELLDLQNDSKQVLLECGCGVGNFIFPLLEEGYSCCIYACDFSPRAIDFVKKHPLYSESTCKAFVCDLTEDSLKETVPVNSVDIVTLIFVLSAIHPDKMLQVLGNIYEILKPDGVLLFRDYGLFDEAMLRFRPGHKLADNFYVRQDGTRAYYFSEEHVASLFQAAGFQVISNNYIKRDTVNKKKNLSVPRIFVQGKFCKPS